MNDDDQLSSPMDDLVALSTQTLQPCSCGWSRRRGAEKAHPRGVVGEGESHEEGELGNEQGNMEEVEEDEEELRCDAVLDSVDRLERVSRLLRIAVGGEQASEGWEHRMATRLLRRWIQLPQAPGLVAWKPDYRQLS